jgi:hypothetical protein
MKKHLLLKNILTKEGNMLFARKTPYMEGEIPKEFLTPLNVVTLDDDTQVAVYKETSVTDETFHLTEPQINTLTPKFFDPNKVEIISKLEINNMNLDQIKELKGIGEKIATQLLTNKPYSDLTDLTTKVKPPMGKTWEEFNFSFQS